MVSTLLNRLTCVMMAAMLLISSTGFILVEHLCQMRGRSVSFWEGTNTCKMHCGASDSPADASDEHQATLKKIPCCEESTYFSRLETPQAKIAEIAVPAALEEAIQAGVFVFVFGHSIYFNWPDLWLGDRWLYGLPSIRYLAILCVWLV